MKKMLLIVLGLFIAVQLITIDRTNPQSDSSLEIKTDPAIKAMLKRSCYDCHSNNSIYPWYSYIAPISWTVKRHIDIGRAWVNFSIWESYTDEQKKKKSKEIFKSLYIAMPISSYTAFHPEAELSPKDRKILRAWAKELVKRHQ